MTPEGLIESILFLAGRKVRKSFLDEIIKTHFGIGDVDLSIDRLNQRYKQNDAGIRIISTEDYAEMVTSDSYYSILKDIFPSNNDNELTDALLETLTIIAYRQPIERSEVDKIRGVSSSKAISILLEKGFIKPVKNDNISDRISYVTTEKFLDYFGIESLKDLPNIQDIKSSLER